MFQESPFMMLKKDHANLTGFAKCEGFIVDLISEVAERAGFHYQMYLVEDGRYGARQPDGSWSGMVGDLIREVYIAPTIASKHGWVTVTTNRSYHQPRWRRPKTVRPNNRGYQENLTVRCAHMTLTCRCHITLCISAITSWERKFAPQNFQEVGRNCYSPVRRTY